MENICPITFEEIKEEFITSCNHKFEKHAIIKWIAINKNCPICRNHLTISTNMINKEQDELITMLLMFYNINIDDLNFLMRMDNGLKEQINVYKNALQLIDDERINIIFYMVHKKNNYDIVNGIMELSLYSWINILKSHS